MSDKKHFATLRFDIPDLEGPDSQARAPFAPPAAKEVVEERLELHDMRTSPDILKGGAGLDTQGFTYVQHRSAIQNADQFMTGRTIEDVYISELESLLCEVTGAKRAVVSNVFFRLKTSAGFDDPKQTVLRDTPLGKALASIPKDGVNVMGRKGEDSLHPARVAHSDYSIQGLRDSIRYCRDDIKAAAFPSLQAEDAGETPRYAAYSIWRPLRTVRRDPLAACDYRTLDKGTGLTEIDYAATSNITESGEYLMHGLLGTPPKHPIKQKWYFLPEQQPDEVLIVKFADTGAEKDESIAPHCLHLSPQLEGTEEEETRNSIEARVFAFF